MVMSAYPTAALLRSLQWVSDRYVSPLDTALIDDLLWEAAGLRRDAIASYVCLVCLFITIYKEIYGFQLYRIT